MTSEYMWNSSPDNKYHIYPEGQDYSVHPCCYTVCDTNCDLKWVYQQ